MFGSDSQRGTGTDSSSVPVTLFVTLLGVGLVAGSVLAALSVPVAATQTQQVGFGDSEPTATTGSLAPPASEVNNTTHHRNPDTVDKSGDLQAVKGWLGGRMGRLLGESTLQLSQAEYQQAQTLLGSQYDSHLERYVDVAGDTADSADDSNAETLERAKQTQREYVSTVQQYRETRAAYERARENGETERARRLARNLSRQASRIERLGAALTEQYAQIESFSDVDLGPATARIRGITQNVTSSAERIVAQEFIETTLVVDTAETASFSDPLRVSGQVQPNRTDSGTSDVNGTVLLRLGPQTTRVDLGQNGTFEATLRPTLVPKGTRALRVEYLPPNAAVFLGANQTVDVQIRSVSPTVSISTNATTVRYGDTVTFRATVAVNDTAVPNVPTAVRIGSRQVASGATAADGELTRQFTVPAQIQPGAQTLRAVLPFEGRAIESGTASTSIRVEESATELTLADGGDTVYGRLVTTDGRPVSGLPVTIQFPDGTRVVETNESGWYQASLPSSDTENRTVQLRARFDGTNTNLESSNATGRVELPAESTGNDPGENSGGVIERVTGSGSVVSRFVDLGVVPWIIGLLVVVGLAGGTLWYTQRDTTGGTTLADSTTPDEADSIGPAGPQEADSDDETRFAAVESHLDDGASTTAVVSLYPTLRAELATEAGDSTRTHWEFLDAVVSREPDVASQLRVVTELYERAAFANETIDETAARRALADARDILVIVQTTGETTPES